MNDERILEILEEIRNILLDIHNEIGRSNTAVEKKLDCISDSITNIEDNIPCIDDESVDESTMVSVDEDCGLYKDDISIPHGFSDPLLADTLMSINGY